MNRFKQLFFVCICLGMCGSSFSATIWMTERVSGNLYFKKFDEFPKDQHQYIGLLYPSGSSIVFSKEAVSLKGYNRYLRPVFVNGRSVRVRQDGRFLTEVSSKEKHKPISVTFEISDHKWLSVWMSVVHIQLPSDWQAYPELVQGLSAPFVRRQVHRLSDSFTRRDLAFLLSFDAQKPTEDPAIDVLVSDGGAAQIGDSLKKGVMGLYPDGTFRPEAGVSQFEWNATMKLGRVLHKKESLLPMTWASVLNSLSKIPSYQHFFQNSVREPQISSDDQQTLMTSILPRTHISRSQLAYLLVQKWGSPSENAAQDALKVLVEKGCIKGEDGGQLFPDRPVTRLECWIIVMRMKQISPRLEVKTGLWPRVSRTHWGWPYLAVALELGWVSDSKPNPDGFLTQEDLDRVWSHLK